MQYRHNTVRQRKIQKSFKAKKSGKKNLIVQTDTLVSAQTISIELFPYAYILTLYAFFTLLYAVQYIVLFFLLVLNRLNNLLFFFFSPYCNFFKLKDWKLLCYCQNILSRNCWCIQIYSNTFLNNYLKVYKRKWLIWS